MKRGGSPSTRLCSEAAPETPCTRSSKATVAVGELGECVGEVGRQVHGAGRPEQARGHRLPLGVDRDRHRGHDEAQAAGVDSPVVLWGAGLAADEVATAAGTISYELFCALARRVPVSEA